LSSCVAVNVIICVLFFSGLRPVLRGWTRQTARQQRSTSANCADSGPRPHSNQNCLLFKTTLLHVDLVQPSSQKSGSSCVLKPSNLKDIPAGLYCPKISGAPPLSTFNTLTLPGSKAEYPLFLRFGVSCSRLLDFRYFSPGPAGLLYSRSPVGLRKFWIALGAFKGAAGIRRCRRLPIRTLGSEASQSEA